MALKSFSEITQKSSFNTQYSWRHSLRTEAISGNWRPLENHEKCLLFHHNKLNLLLKNQILLISCILVKPNVWYSWSLKILTIKRWFPFTFAAMLWLMDRKLQTFSRHLLWQRPSKHCIAEFTAIFVCLLLRWSRWYSMKWSSNFDGS